MNTKKNKHKNKPNKPPNPTPPQNVENVTKIDEKIELPQKCEVNEEKSLIPEISEVVTAPVVEVKETESETPKKPKRNKSKKKKPDSEDNLGESPEKKTQETKSDVTIIPHEPKQEEVAEIKDDMEENDPLDAANVIPSARKKKNKKKTQDKPIEEIKPTDEVLKVITPIPQIGEEIQKIDTEITELFSQKPETPKQDPKKKKNKKKKRTDSERSDKSEEIMSCTSAFQQLLIEDAALTEKPMEQKTDDLNQPAIEDSLETEIINVEDILPPKQIEKPSKVDIPGTKDVAKEEGKSKKKNKKDKKQSQPEKCEEKKADFFPDTAIATEEIPLNVEIVKEIQPDIKLEDFTPIGVKTEKEPSPKPKAKIAKPVEKKRKGKPDNQGTEHLISSETTEVCKPDQTDMETLQKIEIKLEDLLTPSIVESRDITQSITGPIIEPQQPETIMLPEGSTMGKKRKKSPKLPKTKEMPDNQGDFIKLAEKNVTDLIDEGKISIPAESELVKETSVSKTAGEVVPPPVPFETPSKIKPLIDEEPKIVPTDITLSDVSDLEKKQEEEGFETKVSKKKKKTPKTPTHTETTPEIKEDVASPTLKFEESKESLSQVSEEKSDIPVEVPLMADINVKGENIEESEATPDVYFIRSSSQQLLDTNNNILIQEVTNPEGFKHNEPLLIPLIEGSGETPIRTPETVSSGIRVTELEAENNKTPVDEKTDLKSKMMEVNQDMEGLRLSIERSLAEFTAMEKEESEKESKSQLPTKSQESNKTSKCKEAKAEKIVIAMPATKQPTMPSDILSMSPDKPIVAEVEKNPQTPDSPPVCPARKDNKGKGKSKKKGKQEAAQPTTTTAPPQSDSTAPPKETAKEDKQEKTESTQEKGKQQSDTTHDNDNIEETKPENIDTSHPFQSVPTESTDQGEFDPIENFEDALTSSIDDVNKTFEMIAREANDDIEKYQKKLAANKPEINVTEADDDTGTKKDDKINPVSQPKNLLGHHDIPVQSNRTDYKKEKNKTPNARQARVKIKDSTEIEKSKETKDTQTEHKQARKISDISVKESFSRVTNEQEEYVYKYSFRKVFLQSACHVCYKDLSQVRVPCAYCSLVFYCGGKHKDEDWPQHQALCFAVSTIAHMKDQKHIYADAQNITGQDYRLIRMQNIVSCERVLKRRLVPWEQEALLYPRVCAAAECREWRQNKLKDCEGCGQLSYCTSHPEHLPKAHQRWCKSYSLYQKLVCYQQAQGRLEPRLPTKVMTGKYEIPPKMNEVLAVMYEDKIDMNDIQYASLTQLATAPLTAAYCLQLCRKAANAANGVAKRQSLTVHVVGAELQFEADALHKWEVFLLHLQPHVQELRVVLVSPVLNPGNLPLTLLGNIKLCQSCREKNRRVVFKFQDRQHYSEYRISEDFINPDLVCAFNPSIQRSSIYNGKDPWPAAVNTILKLKCPFIVTAYTLSELRKDVARVTQVSSLDCKLVSEPGFNAFASVRPDRNFITDDEMPLLFKNYCSAVVLGC